VVGDVGFCIHLGAQGAKIKVDQTALLTSLINLTVNACHAMDGGRQVVIRSFVGSSALPAQRDSKKECVMVEMLDEGRGMDEHTCSRAFEPFFSAKVKGTGLGLTSVQEFCRSSEGFAEIESAPGRGTSVRLVLPFADTVHPIGSSFEPLKISTGRQVLIVDDEIDTSEALKEILGEEGYICSIVSSSTDARRAMEQQPFDLLLTDVVMPGEGGIELSHWAIIRHQ
jgi:CheY-like chemotaxis protein